MGSFKLASMQREAQDTLNNTLEGTGVPEITSPKIEAYIEKRMEWSCNECRKKFDAQDECPFCGSDDLKQGTICFKAYAQHRSQTDPAKG